MAEGQTTRSSLVLGVDIGGTNIKYALVDCEGRVLERGRLKTRPGRGPERTVADLAQSVGRLAKRGDAVRGAGVGCPGPLSSRTGIVYEAPNLPGWRNVPLRDMLAEALGLPVVLHNDANAATWGEFWRGAARGADTIICYTLGTGVGGGLVIGGRLWTGPDDTAGELGHMNVVPDGPRCGCGSRGCLETYASATAVARRAKEAVAKGVTTSLAYRDKITAEVVFLEAEKGDAFAQQLLAETGMYLGIAAASLTNALNPDMIVIAGGMMAARDYLFPAIEKEIRERAFKQPAARVRLVAAQLGDDAGVIGAAGLAWVEFGKDKDRITG